MFMKDHPSSLLNDVSQFLGVHPRSRTLRGVMLLLLLSSLGLIFFGVTSLQTAAVSEDWQYAVVVDAGSTGSRVHVYKYRTSDDASQLLDIDFRNEKYEKFKPGLSSFAELASSKSKSVALKKAVSKYTEPLLDFARKHIPESRRKRTPFFVLATAGMRKVRDDSDSSALRVMAAMYDAIADSEFISSPKWVRIIEGRDEGLWGWVTANYLNGALQSNGKIKTTGVLEMGGESLQITFTPEQTGRISSGHSSDYLTALKIAKRKYEMFTHSYMGIGMEAGQLLFDQHFAKEQPLTKGNTPCYLTGMTRKFESFEFTGDGDFDLCYEQLSSLISDRTKCAVINSNGANAQMRGRMPVRAAVSKRKGKVGGDVLRRVEGGEKYRVEQMSVSATGKCTPNGVLMPSIPDSKHFYYIENFFYTAKVLNIEHLRGDDFTEGLKVKGVEFCSLPKEQAVAAFPHASEDEIAKTCFCAAWLSAMIDSGFDLTAFDNFQVIRDINDVGIDWALGFLVLNEEEINTRLKMTTYQGLTAFIFGVLLFAIVCMFALLNKSGSVERVKWCFKRKIDSTRYKTETVPFIS